MTDLLRQFGPVVAVVVGLIAAVVVQNMGDPNK